MRSAVSTKLSLCELAGICTCAMYVIDSSRSPTISCRKTEHNVLLIEEWKVLAVFMNLETMFMVQLWISKLFLLLLIQGNTITGLGKSGIKELACLAFRVEICLVYTQTFRFFSSRG